MDNIKLITTTTTPTTVDENNYKFVLSIDGTNITNSNYKEYRIGNPKKNNIIKNNTSITDKQKHELLLYKELGDLLQILFLYIYREIHKNTNNILVTSDKVVYIMCILLGIHCSYFQGSHDQQYRMEYYCPSDNPRDLLNIFLSNACNISIKNEIFILELEKYKNNNSTYTYQIVNIYNSPINIKDEFYIVLINDINIINQSLNQNIIRVVQDFNQNSDQKLCRRNTQLII